METPKQLNLDSGEKVILKALLFTLVDLVLIAGTIYLAWFAYERRVGFMLVFLACAWPQIGWCVF